MALNPRQQAFVREYLLCGNAAEAYRRAGYSCKNAQAAASGGERLLRNAEVSAAIATARSQLEQVVVSPREVLEGLKREALGETMPQNGSRPTDRIAAWEAIAKLLGLHKRAELQAEIEALDNEERAQEATAGTTGQPPGGRPAPAS